MPNAAGLFLQSLSQVASRVPHSFWIAYVGVKRCDKVAELAKQLGAEITVGPQDIPNVGRFAFLTDPQGATFAVLQPD